MGFNFLISSTANQTLKLNQKEQYATHVSFQIKTKTLKATMKETDQGYIVLKGSEAKKELSRSCTETYRNMRRKLLETKILVDFNKELLFAEDAVFNSPSAASNMVLGRNSNGYTEWIAKSGKTFKEIQDSINE